MAPPVTDGQKYQIKCQMVSFSICQQHQTIILVILYQRHLFFLCENVFEPRKHHLRKVLLYFFSVKKCEISCVASIACRSLWWSCSKWNNVLWLVSMLQKWWFWCGRQRMCWKAKIGWELETLLDKDPCQTQQ